MILKIDAVFGLDRVYGTSRTDPTIGRVAIYVLSDINSTFRLSHMLAISKMSSMIGLDRDLALVEDRFGV